MNNPVESGSRRTDHYQGGIHEVRTHRQPRLERLDDVEATDEAEVKLGTERQRVVTLKLTNGTKLEFAGEEADRVWERLTEEALVWSETYSPPQTPFGFHT